MINLLTINAFILADMAGLTDPDVTWLPIFWAYKAGCFCGFI